MSFVYCFEYNDVVTFSFGIPYGYTKLLSLFKEIEETDDIGPSAKICRNKLNYRRGILCKSLGGLPVHILTITGDKENNNRIKRKGAIFTGRVHPGETVSSFVIESFIRFLIGNTPQAIALRSMFIFKIIPMLNPDGVVCGNSRTSLAGVDLNRIWINPDPVLHPCIYYTKKYIQRFTQKHETLIYSDFHGHGRKLGSFIYGCNKIVNGSFTS